MLGSFVADDAGAADSAGLHANHCQTILYTCPFWCSKRPAQVTTQTESERSPGVFQTYQMSLPIELLLIIYLLAGVILHV